VPLEAGALRQHATSVLAKLSQALPGPAAARVQGLPLVFEGEVGEVNAYAACSKGRSFLGITDPLLEISWFLSQTAAHDQVFGTDKVQEYISSVVLGIAPDRPLPRPPARFWPSTQGDPRVVARSQVLLDEIVAFVLGHELAHHYLGHLPCTSQPGGLAELGRVLSSGAPVFNQPNEHGADVYGIQNVLTTGRNLAAAGKPAWTQGGALLLLRFFRSAGSDGLFNFGRTHPSATARVVWVEGAVSTWRATGGVGLPLLPGN
jgi:hypothetical protein